MAEQDVIGALCDGVLDLAFVMRRTPDRRRAIACWPNGSRRKVKAAPRSAREFDIAVDNQLSVDREACTQPFEQRTSCGAGEVSLAQLHRIDTTTAGGDGYIDEVASVCDLAIGNQHQAKHEVDSETCPITRRFCFGYGSSRRAVTRPSIGLDASA